MISAAGSRFVDGVLPYASDRVDVGGDRLLETVSMIARFGPNVKNGPVNLSRHAVSLKKYPGTAPTHRELPRQSVPCFLPWKEANDAIFHAFP